MLETELNGPDEPEQPLDVARFALAASNRALEEQRFEEAARHAERGISHLPDDAFQTQYDLAFALHYNRCECGCALQEDLNELEARCVQLAGRAQTRLERTLITALRVWQLGSRGQPQHAIDIGIAALAELGFELHTEALQRSRDAAWEDILQLIGDRSPEDMVDDLSPVRDPDLVAASELFAALGYPLWTLNPEQMSVLALIMARSTLGEGTTPGSALALATSASQIAFGFGDRERGVQFARAASRLADRLGQLVEETREVVASFNRQMEAADHSDDERDDDEPAAHTHAPTVRHAAAMRPVAPSALAPSPPADQPPAAGQAPSPRDVYLRVLTICDTIRGHVDDASQENVAKLPPLMEVLQANRDTDVLSRVHYHIACGETARVYGDLLTAEDHYEHGIRLAQQHELYDSQGRANELAGCFYRDRGMRTAARAYLEEAWQCYHKAGDGSKVVFMPSQYPGLIRLHALHGGALMQQPKTSVDADATRPITNPRRPRKQPANKPTARNKARAPQAAHLDRRTIRAALADNDGVMTRTAEALGISRQALYRRMKRLDIPSPHARKRKRSRR